MAPRGLDERVDRLARFAAALLALPVVMAAAQAQPAHPATPPVATRSAPVESGIAWLELSAQQRDFLRPLEHDWRSLDAMQKRKWLEITIHVPKMAPDERARIQTRMTDWAKLTPEQRGQARLRYQQVRQMPLRDRQARWDAYQSLPTERKQQLAERAANEASASVAARRAAAARERPAHDATQGKSNLVAAPAFTGSPRPVGPTLVQARPGATTTSIARPPAPPLHQQPGLPKIAATPEFVDRSTLLPRLGPQAAATRRPSDPASTPGVLPSPP